MMTQLYTIIKTTTALVLLAAAPSLWSAPPPDTPTQFTDAYKAFRAGDSARLARLAETLQDTVYAPWMEYWRLRLGIEQDIFTGVPEFLARESGSYLAEKLRADWLRRLGKQQDWKTFQQEYPALAQPDQELACDALQARLDLQRDKMALAMAKPLWFDVVNLPDACQPLMDRLFAERQLNMDDVWTRVRRLLEARRFSDMKTVMGYLPAGHSVAARDLKAVTTQPASYLSGKLPNLAINRPSRELALLAIVRLARSDSADAAKRWQEIENYYAPADRAYAWGQIAWQGALDHEPDALTWYGFTNAAVLTAEQHAWQARAALRARNWPALAQAIEHMPASLASQPEWRYWLGRTRLAQGRQEEAQALFWQIAGSNNFYGILADEELGQPVTLPVRAAPPTQKELAEVEANPGLRRALAILRTDPGPEMRWEASREWAWYLRGMDDRQLLAAAEFARQQGAWDRAIATAERARSQRDFTLLFPAPYRDVVSAKTRAAALDDAWVYALIRQESRFVAEARSVTGALGLMQLMPATARWVARKTDQPYQPARVTHPETNVTLGVNYLKIVANALDNHPALTFAAYNAGPKRARKWRDSQALEGAIYVETIPFGETRDYVKKVMSNVVYYSIIFTDKPQSLKTLLGMVKPTALDEAQAADLP
jgi:soluble lytic murein transglycosylase